MVENEKLRKRIVEIFIDLRKKSVLPDERRA